jgi:hypothetical protein
LLLSIPGTTKANPVKNVHISVRIEGFTPFYEGSLSERLIGNMTEAEYARIKGQETNRGLFPSYYSAQNLQHATFNQVHIVSASILTSECNVDMVHESTGPKSAH